MDTYPTKDTYEIGFLVQPKINWRFAILLHQNYLRWLYALKVLFVKLHWVYLVVKCSFIDNFLSIILLFTSTICIAIWSPLLYINRSLNTIPLYRAIWLSWGSCILPVRLFVCPSAVRPSVYIFVYVRNVKIICEKVILDKQWNTTWWIW